MDTEEEGYPRVGCLNAGQGEVKKDCDEEVDITMIDSRHITPMEVVSSSSKKKGILGGDTTTVDDPDMGKEYSTVSEILKDGEDDLLLKLMMLLRL